MAQKGRRAMPSSPQSAPTRLQVNGDQSPRSGQASDIVYQTITIAAMLLLLGSLWVF